MNIKATNQAPLSNLPKVAEEGIVVAVFRAFLATAGLFYVNLGGAFLSAFVDGLGISRETAGYITSANKYGAAFGALLATFIVKYIPWRQSAYLILLSLISVDLLSFSLTDPETLVAVRFLHGSIGGFLVGLGFSIIARTESHSIYFWQYRYLYCAQIGRNIWPRGSFWCTHCLQYSYPFNGSLYSRLR